MIDKLKYLLKAKLFKTKWNNKGIFPYYQHKVYFPKDSIIFQRAISERIYEHENITIINALIKDNTTVFDVGANIGLMALPMLSTHKNIHVISVEPSPNSFPFLSKTQQNSMFKDRWSLINKAASNKMGRIKFQLAKQEYSAYESILDTNRTEFLNTIEVDCTTIDTIWEEQEKPKVSFIKMDIEGADLLALRGACNCIKQYKPIILMEWNKTNIVPFGLSNESLLNFVSEIDYSVYVLPYFTKCNTLSDLNLFIQLSENYLLVPN